MTVYTLKLFRWFCKTSPDRSELKELDRLTKLNMKKRTLKLLIPPNYNSSYMISQHKDICTNRKMHQSRASTTPAGKHFQLELVPPSAPNMWRSEVVKAERLTSQLTERFDALRSGETEHPPLISSSVWTFSCPPPRGTYLGIVEVASGGVCFNKRTFWEPDYKCLPTPLHSM